MSGQIGLGRHGKFGKINLESIKAGLKKDALKSAEQIKLFQKFDTDNNGILDNKERAALQESLGGYAGDGKITRHEAKKFIKENDLKGDVGKKDVFNFLSQINTLSGNIANTTESTLKDGTSLINVEYNPSEEDGSVLTEMFNSGDGSLYAKKTVIDGKTVTQYYNAEGKVEKEETTEEDTTITTVIYNESGKIKSKTRQKGAVTVYLDENDRVTMKETDKGSDVTEIIKYEYDVEGNLTKTTTINSDGSKIIDDGKTIKTIAEDGSYTVKDKTTGEVTQFDADGNKIEPQKQNETHECTVEYGDTWYGVVQAKYGVTDHQQTMEIVRQLKAQNGVDPKATNMPSTIKLPDVITLKDGQKIELQDIDAKADRSHFVERTEEPPVDEEVRQLKAQNGVDPKATNMPSNTISIEQSQLKEKINSLKGTPTVNEVEPTQQMKENIEKTRDALSNALKNLSKEDLDKIGISAEKRDRMLVYLENITYDGTHDSAQAKGAGIVFSTHMQLEQTADVANVMTLLMHEANHCDEGFLSQYPEYSNKDDLRHRDKDGNPVQKRLVNTLEEERSCESIALLTTAILIKNGTIKGQNNWGRYSDIGVDNRHPVINYLTNPDLLHKDVENWLSGYTNYPDSVANPSIKIEHMQENDKLKLSDAAKAEKPLQLLAGDEIRVDGKIIHTISGSDANGVVLSAFDSIPLLQMTQGGDTSKSIEGMIMFDSLQPSEEELNYWREQNNNDNYAHDIKTQLDNGQVVEIYRNGKPIYSGKMIHSD